VDDLPKVSLKSHRSDEVDVMQARLPFGP
jgi:hypothetical protein